MLLKRLDVARTSDSLQKRGDNLKSFEGTVRSYQSQLSPGRGSFCKRNKALKRDYNCEGCGRRKAGGGDVQIQRKEEQRKYTTVVADLEAP